MHKYCAASTTGHSISLQYPQSVIALADMMCREGYDGPNLFVAEEVAIDLDFLEKHIADRSMRAPNMSMDGCFCVRKDENVRMLLFDCKFRVDNPNNFQCAEIMGKVAGSKNLLPQSGQVYYFHFFVVKDDIYQQARNRFQRMNPSPGREYEPITLLGFHGEFFQ